MIKAGRSIYIEFDDCNGDGLTDSQENAMIGEMREVANKYGYDYHSSGDEVSMKKWFGSLIITEIETAVRKTLGKYK